MLRSLALAMLLVPALTSAQEPVQPRDSVIRRGDRTIYHQHAPSEQEWGYAQAIVVGNTLYMSGTVAGGANFEDEVANVYRRIERTLRVNGFTMQDVVKETVYTKDIPALAAANPARLRAYAGHNPAATWVQITRLLSDGANVEIEVVAIRATSRTP
jgi:enamine deaminase RidA (YjgF/YER057c/UK114 family)